MLTRIIKNNFSSIRIALLVQIIVCLLALGVNAQRNDTSKDNLPTWKGYNGVTLGMTADEVRTKLGAPRSEDGESYFYVFTPTENAQFLFDMNKKVRAISAVYDADNPTQPSFVEVFGKTAVAEPKPDGSIYKMVKYENAGFWISYSRMAGDKAMVIVMIQKM